MTSTPPVLSHPPDTNTTQSKGEIEFTKELEERLKRITEIKNIAGVVVVNSEGITVKSTLDNSLSAQYSVLVSQLSERAKSIVRDLDPSNELTYLRIKSKKHEVLVAPEKDFILIVVQNPTEIRKPDG